MSNEKLHPRGAAPWFRKLQDAICQALEGLDGSAKFLEDTWTREDGGGGVTRVISGGDLIEKGGVSFSEVYGELSESFATQIPGEGRDFHATNVSIVLHPKSPMVPAMHANVRMIGKGDSVWVGGGADLTPYYPKDEDAVHFHRTWKSTCDGFDPTFYPRFKSWCDEYFYLPNRQEMRGIGGIFFDYVGLAAADLPESARRLNPLVLPQAVPTEKAWLFVQEVGRKILEAWVPIAEARRSEPYGEKEREFQLYRRGRYAEFNFLYDRSTKFGLETGGRTESTLMSLPPLVRWTYDWTPDPNTREAALADYLVPRDWVSLELN